MYKKRLLCFEESARLRECEVQCFTRGGFFYLFFSFAKKAHHARKKEDGHHQSLRRDEEKGPKGQKGKKKGEGVKERHNKRTVVTKKREKKPIKSDL
jgi:hypothetical protein